MSLDLTIPEFEEDALDTGTDWPDDIGVQIRVEKVVQVQRRPRALVELEDYSRWGVNSSASYDPPLSRLQIGLDVENSPHPV